MKSERELAEQKGSEEQEDEKRREKNMGKEGEKTAEEKSGHGKETYVGELGRERKKGKERAQSSDGEDHHEDC